MSIRAQSAYLRLTIATQDRQMSSSTPNSLSIRPHTLRSMMSSYRRYLILFARAKCKPNQSTTASPSRKPRAWYTSKIASASSRNPPKSPTARLNMLNPLFAKTTESPQSQTRRPPSMMLTSLVHLLKSIVRLARPFHPPGHLPNEPAPPRAIVCSPRPSSVCAAKTKTPTVRVQVGQAIREIRSVVLI